MSTYPTGEQSASIIEYMRMRISAMEERISHLEKKSRALSVSKDDVSRILLEFLNDELISDEFYKDAINWSDNSIEELSQESVMMWAPEIKEIALRAVRDNILLQFEAINNPPNIFAEFDRVIQAKFMVKKAVS